MKKRNWLILLLIGLCLAVFLGYQALDRIRTDKKAPVITFSEEPLQLSMADPEAALFQGVTASDNRDGDVTASVIVERIQLTQSDGSILIKYAAFDHSGNVAKAERTARYTDYERPRFTLSSSLLFEEKSNLNLMNIIGASDPLDGNIRHRIRATSLDDSSVAGLGEHEVEFRVTNSLGDTVRLTLPVEVFAEDIHTLDLALTNYLIYLDAGSSFDARQYLRSVTWNQETISLDEEIPPSYAVKIDGDVNTRVPGVYAVDYTVTHTVINEYNPGNSQVRTGCARLIVVVEG